MDEFEFSPEASSIEQPVTPPPALRPETDASLRPYEQPAAKKRPNAFWKVLSVVSICLALAMSGVALYFAAQQKGILVYDVPQSNSPTYSYRTDVKEGDALTNQEIIKKVSPSVVTVSVEVASAQGQGSGFGTGIIYTGNGYILTNAHVVEDALSISVKDYDGKTYEATLVGMDTDSDVAVIKIEAEGLTPAEFGKSSQLVPGDKVIAIGTPYVQNMEYTATEGMVSALRESVNFTDLGYMLDLIQHDAAINSGNSGGPLINIYGQVVGINTIKISGTYENLGFALQIDAVLPLAEELMNNGKIVRPGIGITGSTYSADDITGVYVHSVVEGSPAEAAGLRVGDVIIKANDTEIDSINRLKNLINACKVGDTVEITYLRDDVVKKVNMTLTELK